MWEKHIFAWKSAAFYMKRVKTASMFQSLFSLPLLVSISIIHFSHRSKQLNQQLSPWYPAIHLVPCLFPSPSLRPKLAPAGQQVSEATVPEPLRYHFCFFMIHALGGEIIKNRKCTCDTAGEIWLQTWEGRAGMEVTCFMQSKELGRGCPQWGILFALILSFQECKIILLLIALKKEPLHDRFVMLLTSCHPPKWKHQGCIPALKNCWVQQEVPLLVWQLLMVRNFHWVTLGPMSHNPLCAFLWLLSKILHYTLHLSLSKCFLYLVPRDSWFSPYIPGHSFAGSFSST